jgi:hypothetical protein
MYHLDLWLRVLHVKSLRRPGNLGDPPDLGRQIAVFSASGTRRIGDSIDTGDQRLEFPIQELGSVDLKAEGGDAARPAEQRIEG